jgi:hypothetical protein
MNVILVAASCARAFDPYITFELLKGFSWVRLRSRC